MTFESFHIRLGQHTSRGSSQYVPCFDCKCKRTIFVYVNETQYICIDFDGHYSGGSSFYMYMIF